VAEIMRKNKIKAQTGYGYKRRYVKGSKTTTIADIVLDRSFSPSMPNKAWMSGITYVRTCEGFLYVATVLGLFSRRIVSMSRKFHNAMLIPLIPLHLGRKSIDI